MVENKMFHEALEAINNQEHTQASVLFKRLLKSDEKNIDYWLYLSSILENPKDVRLCINKALEIDPENPTAIRGLSLLGEAPSNNKIKAIRPVRTRKFNIPEIYPDSSEINPNQVKLAIPKRQKFWLLVLSLIGFSLIYIGIFGNPFAENPRSYILPSAKDLRPLPATNTPTATSISPTSTATKNPSVIPPIGVPGDIFFTATPRVVDTPHPESAAYLNGLTAFDQGNYESAIDYFSKHLSDSSNDADVRFYLGLAYFQLGDYKNADASFIRALDIDPEFGMAYLWEVLTKLEYLNKPTIGKKLGLAVKYAPDHYRTYVERGKYYLSILTMDQALADLEKAIELAPNNARVHLFATNYYLANKFFEDALQSAQTAIGIDNSMPEIYYVLGQSYYQNALYSEAIYPLETFLEIEPENSEAWFLLGKAHQKNNQHEAALTAFAQVQNLDNDILDIHLFTGISLYELGNSSEAVPMFDLAYQINPKKFEVKIYHGVGLMEKGKVGDAYLEINASSNLAISQEQKALLYYWRGHTLERLGESEKAKLDWEKLLALDLQYVQTNWVEIANQALQGNYLTPTPIP